MTTPGKGGSMKGTHHEDHNTTRQLHASVIDPWTFQFRSGNARLTMTVTRDGRLVTMHEYNRALVKRVSVQADREEAEAFARWLNEALAIKPFRGPE